MAQRLKIHGNLQTRAALASDTFDEKKGTVEVVWTTGARGKRYSWSEGPYYEELEVSEKAVDLSRLNNGASVLNTHGAYELGDVIGVVERAWISNGEGRATIRFSDRAEVQPIKADVKAGILRHVSVGYSTQKLEKVEEVDGVPVYRATRWQPAEISLVPIAFDDGAQVRGRQQQPESYEVEISTRNKEQHMAETTPAAPAAAPVTTVPAQDPTGALLAQARAENARASADAEKIANDRAQKAVEAERVRISEIRRICAMTKLGEPLAQRLIDAKTPLDEARKLVLEEKMNEQAAIDGHIRFEAGDDVRDKFIRGAAASLYERAGLTQTIEDAKSNKRVGHLLKDVATDGGEFRGMRLPDLARQSLEIRGVSTKGLYGDRLIKAALEYRGDAGFQGTGDFTVLLETAVNKTFLGRYATIPVTWPIWCARKSVQDFRTSTFYRPGAFSTLDTVNEQGEVKHKAIPDGAKATLTPATKGNIIGVSRKAIVNDDLGFLNDNASELGASAARTIEADAWALITAASGLGANAPDGVALFNAAHSNIGTTGAMSVATLDSIRAKMALQKDPNSAAYLALRPSVLLVPVELAGTAKVFNTSTGDPTAQSSSAVANKVLGLFPGGIVDSPYLSASSATRVYGLADPNVGPVFAVGFINGQEAPTLTSEQSFNYDGLQMKVILDYGTAVIDFRGAVTCAGA